MPTDAPRDAEGRDEVEAVLEDWIHPGWSIHRIDLGYRLSCAIAALREARKDRALCYAILTALGKDANAVAETHPAVARAMRLLTSDAAILAALRGER